MVLDSSSYLAANLVEQQATTPPQQRLFLVWWGDLPIVERHREAPVAKPERPLSAT